MGYSLLIWSRLQRLVTHFHDEETRDRGKMEHSLNICVTPVYSHLNTRLKPDCIARTCMSSASSSCSLVHLYATLTVGGLFFDRCIEKSFP